MKVLKYAILGLILLNIPSIVRDQSSSVLSNLLSYFSFLLLVLYYILNKRTETNVWMILIGSTFFLISSVSGQNYLPETADFLIYIVKFFIIIVCGYELLKTTSIKELYIILLVGALTILLQILYFVNPLVDYGRYSGFYLNPNNASFICLFGYGLTFAIGNKKLRLLGQIVFTLMGLLTFSRTFVVIWLLINLISIKINIKNIKVFVYGFGLLTILIISSEFLPQKNVRLEQLSSIMSGESVEVSELNQGSRTETWKIYFNDIAENPIFGKGFNAMSGNTVAHKVGVHNMYLKIFGEAGIIPITLFVLMYVYILISSWKIFNYSPYLFILVTVLILFLATNHNFFDYGYLLFLSMWIQADLEKKKKEVELLQYTQND